MLDYTSDAGRNLLGKGRSRISASSHVNDKMDAPHVADVAHSRTQKTVVNLGKAQRVRKLEVRVIDREEKQNTKLPSVGFAEVELQLRRSR